MSTKKTEIPKESSSKKGKEKAIVENDVKTETDEDNSNDTKRERSKDCKYAKDPEQEKEEEQEEQEQEEQEEQEEQQEASQQQQQQEQEQQEQSATASEWMAVWDANAQGYYWWNTITNETTWDNPSGYDQTQYSSTAGVSSNPLDTLLDKIDSQAKTTLDQQVAENMPYEQYFANNNEEGYSYASQAHFNARTGRFTTSQDVERLNPDLFTIENRGTKQMKYYFDVDSYTEEYNRQKQTTSGKKRPLTRKEVEYFKKMKKEKKSKRAREWLLQ